MDPRDDRTSIIRAEFKTFLNNQLKSNVRVVPVPNVSNNSNALTPDMRSPQLSSGPQLPPLSFNSIGPPINPTSNPIPSHERPLTTITERSSVMTHERSLSSVGLLTTKIPTAEKKDEQQQPSLDVKTQQVVPSEVNATLDPVLDRSAMSDNPNPITPIPTPTPSMLTVNTKLETGSKPPLPTLDTSPTATLLTNPHHSPTTTVLTNPHHSPTPTLSTNPHYSPTQSVLTNPYRDSPGNSVSPHHTSPTTMTSSSLLPLQILDGASPPASADLGAPVPYSAATVVPSPVKSEGDISADSHDTATGRSSSDRVRDQSPASSVRLLTVNSTQPFPNVLLESTRNKTHDIIANQPTNKDTMSYEPVNGQQKIISKDHNGSLPTPTVSVQQSQPSTLKSQNDDHANKYINEAGALYYMQQSEAPIASGSRQQLAQQQNRGKEISTEDQAETSTSSLSQVKSTRGSNSLGSAVVKLASATANDSKYSFAQRNSPMSAAINWKSPSASSPIGRLSPTRSGLGRKPSGARAQFTPRSYNGAESFSSQPLTEEEDTMPEQHQKQDSQTFAYDDSNAEALAALTYLDIVDSEVSAPATPPSPPQYHSPIITAPSTEPLKFQLSDHPSGPIPPSMSNSDSVPFKSSFAPSSKVVERKLKAQAQQAAHEAAKHKPGRANGKRKGKATGAWESSEDDDDEEEEDDDDDDVDSDPEVPVMRGSQSTSSHPAISSSSSARPPQSSQHGTSDSNSDIPPPHLRPPRHLPQIPHHRPGK